MTDQVWGYKDGVNKFLEESGGGSSSLTGPVTVTVPGDSAGTQLRLYNDAWDTDPTDPVFAIGVTDDGFAGLYLHNSTPGTPLIDFTARNGHKAVQINFPFIIVGGIGGALPDDADMLNSQLAISLDSTEGAAKVLFKAKDEAGNVVSAEVALT